MLQSNDEEQFGDDPTNQCANGPREDEDVAEQDRDLRSGADEREKTMAGHDCYRIGYRNPQFSRADNSCLWELSEVGEPWNNCLFLLAMCVCSRFSVDPTLPSVSTALRKEDCSRETNPLHPQLTPSHHTHTHTHTHILGRDCPIYQ